MNDVKAHFARQGENYEALMTRLVPCYEVQHIMINELLPADTTKEYRVLDLGCGTGLLSEVLLKKLPKAQVIGFDITQEMLDVYTDRVSLLTDKYAVIQGDYKSDSIGMDYDIILSGMTLHHLNWEEREAFSHTLYASLNPGGIYISSDMIIDGDESVREWQYGLWMQYMRDQGENAEMWYEKHIAKDHPVTLDTNLGWLRNAGFVNACCYWRYCNFAVMCAKKGDTREL